MLVSKQSSITNKHETYDLTKAWRWMRFQSDIDNTFECRLAVLPLSTMSPDARIGDRIDQGVGAWRLNGYVSVICSRRCKRHDL